MKATAVFDMTPGYEVALGMRFAAQVLVNGTTGVAYDEHVWPVLVEGALTSLGYPTATATDDVELNAGDQIFIRAMQEAGSGDGQVINTAAGLCHLAAHLVSRLP